MIPIFDCSGRCDFYVGLFVCSCRSHDAPPPFPLYVCMFIQFAFHCPAIRGEWFCCLLFVSVNLYTDMYHISFLARLCPGASGEHARARISRPVILCIMLPARRPTVSAPRARLVRLAIPLQFARRQCVVRGMRTVGRRQVFAHLGAQRERQLRVSARVANEREMPRNEMQSGRAQLIGLAGVRVQVRVRVRGVSETVSQVGKSRAEGNSARERESVRITRRMREAAETST